MKKMNEKGFSLVELIIVIAIMAVLVGLLAPQYLKYVSNSKVSADLSNADELATNFQVALADGKINLPVSGRDIYMGTSGAAMGANVDLASWPQLKYKGATDWQISIDEEGQAMVYIGCSGAYYEAAPNPKSANGYYTAFHK